jgi:hypothetical protein
VLVAGRLPTSHVDGDVVHYAGLLWLPHAQCHAIVWPWPGGDEMPSVSTTYLMRQRSEAGRRIIQQLKDRPGRRFGRESIVVETVMSI